MSYISRWILPLIILWSGVAHAYPLPTAGEIALRREMLAAPQIASGFNFEGIVALSSCSGSLVRFVHSEPSDRALILTNGHCIGRFPAAGEIIENLPSSRRFRLLDKTGTREIGTVTADTLLYATMTKTDFALYRLTISYSEIEARFQTRALTLADSAPTVGQAIEVLSGYWRRAYACTVEKIVHRLKEGEWISEQSIRYSQPGCEVIGGTSGSPVIDRQSRLVVGVNNTGNESGGRCTDNNPCEIDEDNKIEFEEGRSYGQQTYWVYSCLNERREFELTRPGCLLPH